MAIPTRILCLYLILLLALPVTCLAQDQADIISEDSSFIVTGQVLGLNGDPLSGVTISIEGELDVPAISDQEGNYTLEVNSMKSWLLIASTDQYKASIGQFRRRGQGLSVPVQIPYIYPEFVFAFR